MTALLRHRLSRRSRGKVTVNIYPNDGRTFCDDFLVDEAELRRFAWAVLADLDRPAAEQAAAEEAATLAELTRPVGAKALAKRDNAGCRAWSADKLAGLDGPRGAVLRALAAAGPDGLDSTALGAASAAVAGPAHNIHHVLSNAVRSGLIQRVNDGHFGTRAIYALTPRGADILARANALQAQERDAA